MVVAGDGARSAWVQAVLASLSYCASSVVLTLANKAIFSDSALNFPWTLLAIQSAIVSLLLGAGLFVVCGESPIDRELLGELAAPCVLFTAHVFSNARALRHLSLPLLSVIKSCVPMVLALIERFALGSRISSGTYAAMALIVVANAVSLGTDLDYNPTGYFWVFVNCLANVGYLLMLRFLSASKKGNSDKALHNNILIVIFTLPMAVWFGELPDFFKEFAKTSTRFRVLFALSCLFAAGMSTCVFWVLQTSSGSTLSFVGASNKILIIVLGAILFEVHITPTGWLGIAVGMLASICFTISKSRSMSVEFSSPQQDDVSKIYAKEPSLKKSTDSSSDDAETSESVSEVFLSSSPRKSLPSASV